MNKLVSPADALKDANVTMIQTWMQEHPVVAWCLGHPFWSAGLLLVSLVLLRGLFGAIARLTERIWIAILRAPVRLATWLLTTTTNLLTRSPSTPPVTPSSPEQRLLTILSRLEAMQQEQAALLQEIRTLVVTEVVQMPPESP